MSRLPEPDRLCTICGPWHGPQKATYFFRSDASGATREAACRECSQRAKQYGRPAAVFYAEHGSLPDKVERKKRQRRVNRQAAGGLCPSEFPRGPRQSKTIAERDPMPDDGEEPVSAEELAEVETLRPKTRGDCVNGIRPCPFALCRAHLGYSVSAAGSLVLHSPESKPWEIDPSCSLDVADGGPHSLEEVGDALSMTRERVRQIEEVALRRLRGNGVSSEAIRRLHQYRGP